METSYSDYVNGRVEAIYNSRKLFADRGRITG